MDSFDQGTHHSSKQLKREMSSNIGRKSFINIEITSRLRIHNMMYRNANIVFLNHLNRVIRDQDWGSFNGSGSYEY